jgi:hypothetical protein
LELATGSEAMPQVRLQATAIKFLIAQPGRLIPKDLGHGGKALMPSDYRMWLRK